MDPPRKTIEYSESHSYFPKLPMWWTFKFPVLGKRHGEDCRSPTRGSLPGVETLGSRKNHSSVTHINTYRVD
jgi:hypothetical protein